MLPDSVSQEEFVFKPAATTSPKTTETSSPTAIAAQSFNFPELNALIDQKISEFKANFQTLSSALNNEASQGSSSTKGASEIEEVADEQPETAPSSPQTAENKEELDEREKEMFAVMKAAATQFWSIQRAQWTNQHQSHLQQQSARLATAQDLQERLLQAGRDFDLKLFEEVVNACGRGRDSGYGGEKMGRFWECLLKNDSVAAAGKTDDLLQDLLGIN